MSEFLFEWFKTKHLTTYKQGQILKFIAPTVNCMNNIYSSINTIISTGRNHKKKKARPYHCTALLGCSPFYINFSLRTFFIFSSFQKPSPAIYFCVKPVAFSLILKATHQKNFHSLHFINVKCGLICSCSIDLLNKVNNNNNQFFLPILSYTVERRGKVCNFFFACIVLFFS